MTKSEIAAPLLVLTTLGLCGCGSDPVEEPRERIIVAEPGEAASATPEPSDAEPAPVE